MGVTENIGYKMESFREKLGFDNLLSPTSDESKADVFCIVIGSYTDQQLKYFSYKKNVAAGLNTR